MDSSKLVELRSALISYSDSPLWIEPKRGNFLEYKRLCLLAENSARRGQRPSTVSTPAEADSEQNILLISSDCFSSPPSIFQVSSFLGCHTPVSIVTMNNYFSDNVTDECPGFVGFREFVMKFVHVPIEIGIERHVSKCN